MRLTSDIFPRTKPIPKDLYTDFEFYHGDGEDLDAFARRRYGELILENKKQFSELCNQAMTIDQLKRSIETMKEEIRTISSIYDSMRHLIDLMGDKNGKV